MKELLVLVLPIVMNFVVSYLKSDAWNDATKFAIALCTCIVFGSLTAMVDGNVSPQNIAGSAGVIGMLATSYYKFYFENTHMNFKLEQSGPFVKKDPGTTDGLGNDLPPSNSGETVVLSDRVAKTYTTEPGDRE